jgi:hypothetical protein
MAMAMEGERRRSEHKGTINRQNEAVIFKTT